MKPERKKELEEEAKLQTVEDKQLIHILQNHLVGAFMQLHASHMEAASIAGDERAQRLMDMIERVLDEVQELSEEILDTIPGMMNREEAKKEVDQWQLKQWLDNAEGVEEEEGDVDPS